MRFQPAHDLGQLLVRLRVDGPQVVQRQRVADAGDDVLALRVGQVVAVRAGLPGRRVAGESHSGAAGVAEVAEHHGADVHRGAEVLRDAFAAPVQPGPVGVPGVEDRVDRQVQLFPRVLREFVAGMLADCLLERVDQAFQVVDVQFQVTGHPFCGFGLVQRVGEHLARHFQHRLAEHLQQPPVGIPGEPLVTADLREALDAGVVEPDVQHRFHHSGHRELRSGTDTHQQRIVPVAQLAADVVLQLAQRHGDLHPQFARLVAQRQVLPTRLGGDGETGRDRQAELRHLREVGALAAEQILLVLVSLGEVVDVLGHREGSFATGPAVGPLLGAWQRSRRPHPGQPQGELTTPCTGSKGICDCGPGNPDDRQPSRSTRWFRHVRSRPPASAPAEPS